LIHLFRKEVHIIKPLNNSQRIAASIGKIYKDGTERPNRIKIAVQEGKRLCFL
jgi:hypothetical protein